jgi:hypothetical protein
VLVGQRPLTLPSSVLELDEFSQYIPTLRGSGDSIGPKCSKFATISTDRRSLGNSGSSKAVEEEREIGQYSANK